MSIMHIDYYMLGIFWGMVMLLVVNNIIRVILDRLEERK